MNKAFKVLWNDARRSFVVSSETQRSHGKPKKFTKTLLATALAGLMAVGSSAFAATTINNDSFANGDYDSTKFISGGGGDITIQTNGDAREALKAITSGDIDIDQIREAFGYGNRDLINGGNEGYEATLVGFAGGQNFQDDQTWGSLFMAAAGLSVAGKDDLANVVGKLMNALTPSTVTDRTVDGDININIGGSGTNPLMIGSVGGDNFINPSLSLSMGEVGQAPDYGNGQDLIRNIVRNGNVNISAQTGNLIGLIGGSSAINLGGMTLFMGNVDAGRLGYKDIYAKVHAAETNVILNGRTVLNLSGETSSVGVFAGGSAIAITGKATSTVTGSSNIVVDTETQGQGFEGINVGLVGGGLSLATMGGSSTTIVGQNTDIEIKNGLAGLVMGGGTAVSADISQVLNYLKGANYDYTENILFDDELIHQGGTTTSISQNVDISVGSGSSVFGLMGGGTAIAYQVEDATEASKATASVKSVNIVIGEKGAGSAFNEDGSATGEGRVSKSEYFQALQGVLASIDSGLDESTIQGAVDTIASTSGVTVGVLGGGIAASWAREASGDANTTPVATSVVDSVNIGVLSGYNVGIVGGGLAMASAPESGTEDSQDLVQTAASTEVKNGVTMTFAGGETVGVMGGGIAVFSGTKEQNNGIGAQSSVSSVDIGLTGDASIDGVVMGGLAIDDTNPTDDGTPNGNPVATKNVSSVVDQATFVADSGSLNRLNFAAFAGHENQYPNNPNNTAPDVRDHLDALAYAVDHQRVAIVGGGLASGMQDTEEVQGQAHVGSSTISLGEDVQVGSATNTSNVFGGGIAANGGKSTVDEVSIQVSEQATVYGDIYAGGIAQVSGYEGNPEYYNNTVSSVDKAEIAIYGGEIHGDLHAGGVVSGIGDNDIENKATATVNDSTIVLGSSEALVKEDALIDGTNTGTSTLQFVQDSFDMTHKSVVGFDTIEGYAQSVTNIAYTFGDKDSTSVTGNVGFASVTAETGKSMTVGTDDAMGAVSIKTIEDNNANLGLGVANGVLALNADSTEDALAAYQGASVQNAVYVSGVMGSDWLKGSTITVGSFADATGEGIFVGSDGALIADADGDTNVSNITFADGSKIHFSDVAQAAAGDKTVTVSDDASNTSVDNVLYKATVEQRDQQYIYSFNSRTGSELDEVGLGDVDDTGALGDISKQDDASSDYINDFLDQTTGGVTNSNRSQQLNAALNLAAAAGVQTVAIDSATMGIDAASQRASLIHDFAEGGVLFAEASGKRFEMGGSSDFGAIKADLGGLVVGGEYSANDWTFGALANLGTGTVRGQDDNSGIRNEVDYYGVQAYAGKRFGMMNVIGQVGYVTTSNDVSHTTVANEKADIDADVLSVGVRGEMRFDLTQNSRLVPYIGFNYLRVNTDGYNTEQGLRVKEQDQDVFTVPVGVKFAGDMQTASGWVMTPSMDIGYVHAFGDRDTEARTQVGATTAHTTMDVWAESVVRTSFGLKAQKDNWGVGVQAGTALGSDDTKELFGQVRVDYRF